MIRLKIKDFVVFSERSDTSSERFELEFRNIIFRRVLRDFDRVQKVPIRVWTVGQVLFRVVQVCIEFIESERKFQIIRRGL